MTTMGAGGAPGVEGSRKKVKRLIDMDNSVVTVGGGGIRGLNGNGKKYKMIMALNL